MVAVSASRRSETDAARPIDRRRPIAIYQQLKTIRGLFAGATKG